MVPISPLYLEVYGFLLFLLLLILATLGLMGVTSMLMELLTKQIQLQRKIQLLFTFIGKTLTIVIFLSSYYARNLDLGAFILAAPVLRALHYVIVTEKIHANEEVQAS